MDRAQRKHWFKEGSPKEGATTDFLGTLKDAGAGIQPHLSYRQIYWDWEAY